MLVENNFISKRYITIVEKLPVHLQNHAKSLPYLLGLVENSDGQWEDFTRIKIAYDLPGLIIPDHSKDAGLDSSTIFEQYRYLHLYCLLYFLCQDRVADNDISGSQLIDDLCSVFRTKIISELDQLTQGKGEQIFGDYFFAWKKGVAAEKNAIFERSLTMQNYGTVIRNKNRYLTMSSRVFLLNNRKNGQFCDLIIDGMITALQCRSDALCSMKDKEHFGISFPEMLHCSACELYDSAIIVMKGLLKLSVNSGLMHLSDGIQECITQKFSLPWNSDTCSNHITSTLFALNIFPSLAKII